MSTEQIPQRERSGRLILAALLLLALVGGGAFYWRAPDPVAPATIAVTPTPPITTAAPVREPPHTDPVTPSFDIVRVTPEGSTVIAGRAEPGAEVVIRDGDRTLGATRSDRNGEFVVVPTDRLPSGGRELTLAARNADGSEARGADSVIVMVPQPAPPSPKPATTGATAAPQSQDQSQNSIPAQALALLLPRDAAPRLIQPPAKGARDALALGTVDYDQTGSIRFSGSAKPSSPVRVYVDDKAAGEARTDDAGQWTVTPADRLEAGLHQLRVDQLGGDGKVQQRVALPFQRTETAPDGLAAGQTVVQPGQNLWRIARASYGQGTRYTVIFLANRAQIRNPNLIYPGQVFAVPPGE